MVERVPMRRKAGSWALQMEEELFQMMAGAVAALSAAGCALVGGHSSEGPEAALGFSITGAAT
jgi:selenide, water dikinase